MRAGVGAAAVLSVSACMPTGSSTTGSTTPPAPATSSPSSTQPQITRPEQRELTAAQVRAALPRAKDLGDGWADNDVTGGSLEYEPKECGDAFLAGPQGEAFREEHRTASAQADFASPGSEYLSAFVYTHDEPVPQSLLTLAGEAMGRCHEYQAVYGDGSTQTREIQGLQVEQVGDRSMALTSQGTTGPPANRIMVVSGHTYVVVNYVGSQRDPGPLLRTVATEVLKRMPS